MPRRKQELWVRTAVCTATCNFELGPSNFKSLKYTCKIMMCIRDCFLIEMFGKIMSSNGELDLFLILFLDCQRAHLLLTKSKHK